MQPDAGEAIIANSFREHHERILNYAYRLAGNWDEAEDVASHVFLSLAEEVRRDRAPRDVLPWLYRSTSNRVVSNQRRAAVRAGSLGEVWNLLLGRAGRTVSVDEELAAVRVAMLRLGAADREIIVLCYDEELEHSTVASILGIGESSVRSRLSRALARLRKQLGVNNHE